MKHGKRYAEAAKLVDRATLYDVNEAVALVKKTANAKFDETVELHPVMKKRSVYMPAITMPIPSVSAMKEVWMRKAVLPTPGHRPSVLPSSPCFDP